MSKIKTRVVPSFQGMARPDFAAAKNPHSDAGAAWIAQYFDEQARVWFDIGDEQPNRKAAAEREADYRLRKTARPIELTPHHQHGGLYADWWESPVVIRADSRYLRGEREWGVGYVGPNGKARRVHGGPNLPGPYAFLINMPTVIDTGLAASERRARRDAGLEFRLEVGESLVVGGYVFVLADNDRYGYPTLEFHGMADLSWCSQCKPGHDRGDGTCERHGKTIMR